MKFDLCNKYDSSDMTIDNTIEGFHMLEVYSSSDIIMMGVNTLCTLFFLSMFSSLDFSGKFFYRVNYCSVLKRIMYYFSHIFFSNKVLTSIFFV